MNERTDFAWFLNGSDAPLPNLTNVSFASSVFSATAPTSTGGNVFLLDSPNPVAARLGKNGGNYPIGASYYRVLAIRMNTTGSGASALAWSRDHMFGDGTLTVSGGFSLQPGWRTYLIDIPSLGRASGPLVWGGTPAGDPSSGGVLRSLQMFLSFNSPPVNLQIDWIRLVNIDPSLCRQVTWSGFSGAVDVYLVSGGQQTLLASGVNNNSASIGCSPAGSGYNFYAGALAPGSYQVRVTSGATTATSGNAYQVNDIPVLTLTSPSEEGSTDDFATTRLGNPWDMNAVSDVPFPQNITGPAIQSINAETPAGTNLGAVNVYSATSTPNQPGLVGDPILGVFSNPSGVKIDPLHYRILTVEYGIPNLPRDLVNGSVARVVWRVAGDVPSVSESIIVDSRAGANVMDKFSVDMADRSVLPIVQGSQTGWVRGPSGLGIDLFRFDPHEFSSPTPFYVRRIKLAALEHVTTGGAYTIRWTATKSSGTVTLFYDTDKNPAGGLTQIGAASTSAGVFNWNVNLPVGEYFIYAQIDDGQGNLNATYSRWPIAVDPTPPPKPAGFRILN